MSSIDFGELVESTFCVRNQVLLLGAHGEERLEQQTQSGLKRFNNFIYI